MNRQLANRHRQRGAALVESALTIALFLLLVMAIIEFALLLFTWTRGVEATREVARFAIVNNPVTALSGLDCDNGGGGTSVNCGGVATCQPMVERMQRFLPQATGANLRITYSCSMAGAPDRPAELLLAEVRAEIVEFNYAMVLPGLVGLPRDWPLPAMATTRTGESLYTID